MASASTSVGPFTLNAVQQSPDNTFVYTLSTPDGPAVIGLPSDLQLGATTGGPVSGNSNLTIVNVGQASFELTNEEATTLISSFGQMYQTVSAEAQQQLTTITADPVQPDNANTTTNTSVTTTDTTIIPIQSDPIVTANLQPDLIQNPIPANITVVNTAPTEQITSLENITVVNPANDPSLQNVNLTGVPDVALATAPSSGQGIVLGATQQSAINQDQLNATAQADWRVRLALSPATNVNYMYKADDPGILRPLRDTNGVIFPYTPTVAVTYAASYESSALTHSNYKVNQYGSSSVDSVSLTCDFTAQDVFEANYVLAVIHFFRSMTKMFYGQDQNPTRGTPPPLCYLYGLGDYQFSAHPLAITGFTYSLPNDVDYIATSGASAAASPQNSINPTGTASSALARLGGQLGIGGLGRPASFASTSVSAGSGTTWVPTKINMSISCLPMMSRNQVSNQFSLAAYANGSLLQGARNPNGGFW